MRPKVAVIVLNYNGLEDTIECLNSLSKVIYPNYDVVVVDNHSDDDNDVRVLGERYKDVHIVRCKSNKGFGGGNNRGIRYVLDRIKAEYLLLLNNDVVVKPDFIGALVDVIESDPRAGASVAKILHYSKPDRIEAAGNHIAMWRGQNYRLGFMQKDHRKFDRVKELNSASINGFLVSAKVVWDVGFFDEDYFIYMDDADYCTRLIRKGYKILYAPKAMIYHKVGAVTRRVTGLPQYYLARNNFRFMRQNVPKGQYRLFMLYFFGFHLWFMLLVYLGYFRSIKVVKNYIIGVLDGIAGITGEAEL